MIAKEIVKNYLKRNGYDGLAGDECGCERSDLMPCGEFGANCEAGHKVKCDCDCGECELAVRGSKSCWHMRPCKKKRE